MESFHNNITENGLDHIFSTWVISEAVGVEKPDQRMFETVLSNLGLTEADKPRIIIVGNNLSRDVLGANRFGITSVHLCWSPRYPHQMRGETACRTAWLRKSFWYSKPTLISALPTLRSRSSGSVPADAPARAASGCLDTAEPMPGIPEDLSLVHTQLENGVLYILLRNYSGVSGYRRIRMPGAVLREVDLLRRPRGESRRDELEIAVRPYGLHCIALERGLKGVWE